MAFKHAPPLRRCPICKGRYSSWNSLQAVCGKVACAIAHGKGKAAKKALRARRAARRDNRAARERLKSIHVLTAEAQAVFNRFCRLRDDLAGRPCITSGVLNPPPRHGGAWDAGHFLSVGSHPELRFNEDNCHRQSKADNAGSGRFSSQQRTISAKYRENLIARIGIEKVLWLEGPHEPKRYRHDELREIKKTYLRKIRALKASNPSAAGGEELAAPGLTVVP